jgi:hypothetical protein
MECFVIFVMACCWFKACESKPHNVVTYKPEAYEKETAMTRKLSYNKKQPSFFLLIAIVGFVAIHIGFSTTFLIPFAEGTFEAPLSIYIHGIFAFAWILLFLVQTWLIHTKSYKTHMFLGLLGLFIAFGTAITMIPAGLFAVEKEINAGLGDTAISGLVGTFTSSIMFLLLVLVGLYYRRNSPCHKRFLLLATIVVLWPAWFRFRHFFPSIERPDIWFAVVLADSLIIISWIWDKFSYGNVHPTLKYVGLFIILEHFFEILMFDSAGWRVVANFLYTIFK